MAGLEFRYIEGREGGRNANIQRVPFQLLVSISVLNETFGNQEMKPNRVMLDIVLQSINHGPRALGHLSYSAIVSRAVGILGYIRRAL